MTLKKYISIGCTTAINVEGLHDNQVVIVTAAGIIMGKMASENDDSQKPILTLVNQLTADYANDNNINTVEDLPDNDGYLVLADAKLVSSGITTNFTSLVVFFDQIIGITIGKPGDG